MFIVFKKLCFVIFFCVKSLFVTSGYNHLREKERKKNDRPYDELTSVVCDLRGGVLCVCVSWSPFGAIEPTSFVNFLYFFFWFPQEKTLPADK